MAERAQTIPAPSQWPNPFSMADDLVEYAVDSVQRSVLFWDVMRRRGNQAMAENPDGKPVVLVFDYEVVIDGRRLERPVNYLLLEIETPEGVEPNPTKRPFLVIDPRAGHGPGIGGSKADSQIGMALRAGHPCYFASFVQEPVPGQTIADVARAEARFLEEIARRHPEADGKPCVIGNCQAGWAVALLSSVRPDLVGPITLSGAPLSYWAGVKGRNPMRYLGGMLGGTWMSTLASDLGNGRFDGANLVDNFENANPGNTYWTKLYNLYSKIDTEEQRFLGFEKWWSRFFLMNEEEIRFIVEELFVGNKLTSGEIVTEKGVRIDIRNIRSPILVFCSDGDNITPPQQALHWIIDLYDSVDEIRAREQTIVYCVHERIGHLGIFVSGKVVTKQHAEFTSNADLVDILPPGLYEAVIVEKSEGDTNPDLAEGDFITRFEERTLDDIRAFGELEDDDEAVFATVARVSAINQGLYDRFVSPWLRAWTTEGTADFLRQTQRLRFQNRLWSDANPWLAQVPAMAKSVRQNRRPARPDNPFLSMQTAISDGIVQWLDGYRDMRDAATEQLFYAVYGSPWTQALVGLGVDGAKPRPPRARDEAFEALIEKKKADLLSRIDEGGADAAAVRALIYVGMADHIVDERGFGMLRRIVEERQLKGGLSDFKATMREQFFMLLLDEERALAALPRMVTDPRQRQDIVDIVGRVASARGPLGKGREARLDRLADLWDVTTIAMQPAEPSEPAKPRSARKAPAKPRRSRRRAA